MIASGLCGKATCILNAIGFAYILFCDQEEDFCNNLKCLWNYFYFRNLGENKWRVFFMKKAGKKYFWVRTKTVKFTSGDAGMFKKSSFGERWYWQIFLLIESSFSSNPSLKGNLKLKIEKMWTFCPYVNFQFSHDISVAHQYFKYI